MSWTGHFWTLGPFVRYSLMPPRAPASSHFETLIEDPSIGSVRLSGRLRQQAAPARSTIVVIVHGLGGSASSYYSIKAAQAAERAGLDSLRLNLRGADRRGADYYHAGLTADLEAALASEALRRYETILLMSFSLGGNMTLRYLADRPDPRVRAASTICSPIDLQGSARAIDESRRAIYRRHVLRALKDIYREVAATRAVPLPVEDAERIDTMEEWDDEIIAPRHGFADAGDYWAKASAYKILPQISLPTLFLASTRDPMVLIENVRPWLPKTDGAVRGLITEGGGHVGFPDNLDLGMGISGLVEDQIIQWMLLPR